MTSSQAPYSSQDWSNSYFMPGESDRSISAWRAWLAKEGARCVDPEGIPMMHSGLASLKTLCLGAEVVSVAGLAAVEALKQELRSRQALPLLEQVVRLSDGKDVSEDVDQALELVAGHFCDCLDFRDFRLGDSLAAGSTRVSLQVLRQHRKKSEAPSPGHDASRPGTVTPSLSGYSAQVSPHKFAVHVLQRQIAFASEEAARTGRTRGPSPKPSPDLLGLESEDEAEDVAVDAMEDRLSDLGALVSMDTVEDISEELADSVPDELLRKLAGLAEFFDTATTPPITGAVAVRSLLLTDKADFTRQLFRDLFHRDKKLQWMVVCGEVPAEFLREVSWHPQSSLALRRMLAGTCF
ncbi:hypothetical protein AK812_SmicGene31529 [Symbiodinium microadriaticum]|uniref:Uncharacterized protein n=1 Tax=Symbiodinium microadriaticum TaxID=2951 RepID=A0A1Q9CWH1_SYMMI|nr:hypothetical protein AK812_SmicGene31529 [Symbiodinium microadriaticum]